MTTPELEKLIEETAAKLGEHFDAVQILVTFPADGGGTAMVSRGTGNWYARQGMAQEFIGRDRAREQAFEIAERLKPGEET
jgi:hypothetical protein